MEAWTFLASSPKEVVTTVSQYLVELLHVVRRCDKCEAVCLYFDRDRNLRQMRWFNLVTENSDDSCCDQKTTTLCEKCCVTPEPFLSVSGENTFF